MLSAERSSMSVWGLYKGLNPLYILSCCYAMIEHQLCDLSLSRVYCKLAISSLPLALLQEGCISSSAISLSLSPSLSLHPLWAALLHSLPPLMPLISLFSAATLTWYQSCVFQQQGQFESCVFRRVRGCVFQQVWG